MERMIRHSGKVALVTGGSRGIGRAIVERLASEGAIVYFTYRSAQAQAEEVERKFPGQVFGVQADVRDTARMDQLLRQILDQHPTIHILVHNAGIARDNLLLRMKDEEWNEVLEVNLHAVFRLTRLALKPMLRARTGSIILISSIIGLMGNAGQINYATAKAGMLGFARSLAREVGSRNIRVNVVAPGFIETDMTASIPQEVREAFRKQIALGRLGKPEEVASVVSFLASDEASYITGQVLTVCGGYLICGA